VDREARGREARDREATVVLWGAIAVGVVLRLLVFRGQGFPTDVGTFWAWAERLAEIGPTGFYEPGYFSDYPPGFLYVLWLVGAIFDGEALRLVVKALSIPADIGVAVLLFRVVRGTAGPLAGALTGGLWMLQPGPIFAGPFWGQVDSWGTLPFLAALVAAGQKRWLLAIPWYKAVSLFTTPSPACAEICRSTGPIFGAGSAQCVRPRTRGIALLRGRAAVASARKIRRGDPDTPRGHEES